MRKYSFRKKIAFTLAGIALSTIFAFLVVEIAVRLFSPIEYLTPEMLKNGRIQYESSLFARHVIAPKEMAVERVGGGTGIVYHINSKGYRGPDFTAKKPEGTIRIIFYGGSAVFDLASSEEDDWPHRTEKILRQNGFSNVEVINAGIPGHASFDAVGRLFSEGHIFEPDYVVLYNAWNDFKYFQSQKPLLRHFKPYDDSMDPRLNYQNVADRLLSERFHAYGLLRRAYYRWKLNVGIEGAVPLGELASDVTELNFDQYRLNIEVFVDIARNIGAEPVLMTQARLVRRDNTESQKTRISYEMVRLTHDALVSAFEKTDEIIIDVARRKGTILIDASSDVAARDELFSDQIHTTDKGSEELATLTSRTFAELLSRSESNAKRLR